MHSSNQYSANEWNFILRLKSGVLNRIKKLILQYSTSIFFSCTCLNWLTTLKSLMIRTALGSSQKLGQAAKHLVDGSEKCICRLSFEF